MPNVLASVDTKQQDGLRLLLVFGVVIAGLYFGSAVFVPIALAILLSFVLAPGVRLLHRWHLGRVLPVILMTLFAFCLIFALSGLMAMQVRDFAAELPRYQSTVEGKVESLRGLAARAGLQRAMDVVGNMSHAIEQSGTSKEVAPENLTAAGSQPMPVVVRQPDRTPLETLSGLLTPLLHPLATTAVVVVFVTFILLQREDLRNRLIRLFGAGDLHRSTSAIDDAARRLSRYLVSQLAVNTVAGLTVGVALWFVGVPSPVLWGILFGCLRFVPYVGPPLALLPPLAVAAAVSSGWATALWTLGVFGVVEAVVGQVVEPLLYGHNTGLSPLAVVVAATFWTALWGPIGLILSTPMTVCLVVLGRHVEQLNFLDVLLGDQPPLSMPEVFYQRMLANDPIEASDQAEQCLKTRSSTDYYDKVVLPGLLLAQDDVAQGRLDVERQKKIAAATAEVIDDLAEADDKAEAKPRKSPMSPQALFDKIAHRPADGEPASAFATIPDPQLADGWDEPGAVLCVGGRGPLDDALAAVLAQVMSRHGFGAAAASHEMLGRARIHDLDLRRARLVWVCCLDAGSPAFRRFLVRRLHGSAPQAKIVIPAWWRNTEGGAREVEDNANAENRVTTLVEALAHAFGQASEGAVAVAAPAVAAKADAPGPAPLSAAS